MWIVVISCCATGPVVKYADRQATSDAQGNFSVPNLPAAAYEIRVEKSGFQTAVLSAFDLRVGQIARPTITLTVGAVTESVSVRAEAPLLQSQSAEVGQVIDKSRSRTCH